MTTSLHRCTVRGWWCMHCMQQPSCGQELGCQWWLWRLVPLWTYQIGSHTRRPRLVASYVKTVWQKKTLNSSWNELITCWLPPTNWEINKLQSNERINRYRMLKRSIRWCSVLPRPPFWPKMYHVDIMPPVVRSSERDKIAFTVYKWIE